MGTTAMVTIGLVLFAVFGLFVAIAYAYVTNEASWLEIRRKLLILVLGYGGDVVERSFAAIVAIVTSVPDYFDLNSILELLEIKQVHFPTQNSTRPP